MVRFLLFFFKTLFSVFLLKLTSIDWPLNLSGWILVRRSFILCFRLVVLKELRMTGMIETDLFLSSV